MYIMINKAHERNRLTVWKKFLSYEIICQCRNQHTLYIECLWVYYPTRLKERTAKDQWGHSVWNRRFGLSFVDRKSFQVPNPNGNNELKPVPQIYCNLWLKLPLICLLFYKKPMSAIGSACVKTNYCKFSL